MKTTHASKQLQTQSSLLNWTHEKTPKSGPRSQEETPGREAFDRFLEFLLTPSQRILKAQSSYEGMDATHLMILQFPFCVGALLVKHLVASIARLAGCSAVLPDRTS